MAQVIHPHATHLSGDLSFLFFLASAADGQHWDGTDALANKRRPEVRDSDLQGLKYFKILDPLLERRLFLTRPFSQWTVSPAVVQVTI